MAYVRKFLDLSTAHLSAEDIAYIEGEIAIGCSAYSGENGFFAHCQEDCDNPGELTADEKRPAGLSRIFRHAIENGCEYVLFDRDAEPDPALPVFEEETA